MDCLKEKSNEMNEEQFDEILKDGKDLKSMRIIFDETRKVLSADGIILVADSHGIPRKIAVDYTEHDEDYKKKIRELQEHIAKQSELIRGYDYEILRLKAQCQKLTENERISYQRLNGDKNELPTEPIKIADWLIDRHIEQVEKMSVNPADLEDMRKLQIDNLRQIAEHLLVFCGRE